MIERGNPIPSVGIKLVTADGTNDVDSATALGSGLVVLFSVPGAFTPTCHVNHLPSFLANADKLREAGVSKIVCAASNDAHVMKAWAEASNALNEVEFLADGNADFAEALGLDRDFGQFGMGTRWARAAMIIREGVVQDVFVEDAPGVNVSGAPAILTALGAA